VDGSAEAEEALEPTLVLGDLIGAEYTLLQVLSRRRNSHWRGSSVPNETARDAQLAGARSYLRTLSCRLSDRVRRVHWRAVRETGSIAEAILWHAQNLRSDLIALAARRRGGLDRWLRNGAADRVIRHAVTPVFVVPVLAKSAFQEGGAVSSK
jgi:nucleotide-binding universal stress UspA family protein